jgi:hypothetical protein
VCGPGHLTTLQVPRTCDRDSCQIEHQFPPLGELWLVFTLLLFITNILYMFRPNWPSSGHKLVLLSAAMPVFGFMFLLVAFLFRCTGVLDMFVAIFHCLRVETPQTWRARSPYSQPPGTEWRSYTPALGCLSIASPHGNYSLHFF